MEKNKFANYLLLLSIKIPAIMMGYATIMAASIDDRNGCSISPDNKGCTLNRPVDLERQAANKPSSIPPNGYHSLKSYKY